MGVHQIRVTVTLLVIIAFLVSMHVIVSPIIAEMENTAQKLMLVRPFPVDSMPHVVEQVPIYTLVSVILDLSISAIMEPIVSPSIHAIVVRATKMPTVAIPALDSILVCVTLVILAMV